MTRGQKQKIRTTVKYAVWMGLGVALAAGVNYVLNKGE